MAHDLAPIIDDSTSIDYLIAPPGKARGLDLSSRPEGFAYGGTAEPFPDILVIPRSEWQARIKEREDRKATNRDVVDLSGLPCKDQQQTNFCWVNGPTYTIETGRVAQGQETVILSAASAGSQITGYRNVGNWGKAALEFIAAHGVVPEGTQYWPHNAIDPRYATKANLALAMSYRQTAWWELQPGNIDHLVSCLFLGLHVAVGYNWWEHEVTAVDPVWLDGTVALLCRNSLGMGYGDKGYFKIQGQRMLPDDAVCARVILPSNAPTLASAGLLSYNAPALTA